MRARSLRVRNARSSHRTVAVTSVPYAGHRGSTLSSLSIVAMGSVGDEVSRVIGVGSGDLFRTRGGVGLYKLFINHLSLGLHTAIRPSYHCVFFKMLSLGMSRNTK